MIRTALSCMFVVMSIAAPARAQTSPKPALNLTLTGLVSIQPGDTSYLGSPYLDRTLSGTGPGIAAGVRFIDSQRHFIVGAEFSRTWIEIEQNGRIVGGHATGRLRDSLVSGVGGFSASSHSVTWDVLAGASWLLDSPTLNDTSVDEFAAESPMRIGFTAGGDIAKTTRDRVSLLATFRYSDVDRSIHATQAGVGRHLYRIGVGVRIDITPH